ncbi:MAG: DegT/DnrJ/EryC1/StrS family aminotransferase [Candidatus Omnitrophica bacterium]|nr:DegT/DnrJ/EryC1/StrS family aminotransferase [Candidatus Omnitrophota bacterium]
MLKAYPRHSVDITSIEYWKIFSMLFLGKMFKGACALRFEKLFAGYIGTFYAVAIPSARLGLYLLFKYFNFPKDAEILITPFTHQSIFTVIKSFGFKPVFVDIDEKTYNTSPSAVKAKINEKTKLLILTHMWGQPCDMEGFMRLKNKYGFNIIEDCAMACGAEFSGQKVGSFGDASIFSFGKAKAISTFGGGMLCTNEKKINDFVRNTSKTFKDNKPLPLILSIINCMIANILTRPRMFYLTLYPVLRFFNIRDPYNPIEHKKESLDILENIPESWKVRMSNLQVAIGIKQLEDLDKHNNKRIANSLVLDKTIQGSENVSVPVCLPESKHIYLYYALFIEGDYDMNGIREILIKFGIDSQLNELTTPEQLKIFGANADDYPVFKKIAKRLLIIPNGIYLTQKDAEYVGTSCKRIFNSIR